MKSPNCKSLNISVKDSRPTKDNETMRRRRECSNCSHRWTTYEYSEEQIKDIERKARMFGRLKRR